MADGPQMFAHVPEFFFGDGRFNGTMQNVVGPTLVATATKFGLGRDADAYRLVCLFSAERV